MSEDLNPEGLASECVILAAMLMVPNSQVGCSHFKWLLCSLSVHLYLCASSFVLNTYRWSLEGYPCLPWGSPVLACASHRPAVWPRTLHPHPLPDTKGGCQEAWAPPLLRV